VLYRVPAPFRGEPVGGRVPCGVGRLDGPHRPRGRFQWRTLRGGSHWSRRFYHCESAGPFEAPPAERSLR
jgi:hypothetical protein